MTINDIIAYEQGELSEPETVALFQRLIDDGSVWKLQGAYSRTAMQLIEAGLCTLGPTGCRDYYGNYVPSRFEMKSGTKASLEYAERMHSESE